MDFSYIAGFFDGEGCAIVNTKLKKSSISMVQSKKQDAVLFEIKRFLADHSITAGIYHAETFPGRILGSLQVSECRSLVKLLTSILPMLIVKKEKAIEVLKMAQCRVDKKDRFIKNLSLCEQEYRDGKSIKYLGEKYMINGQRLKQHLQSQGIPIRTPKEASQNFQVRASEDFKRRRHEYAIIGNLTRHGRL